MTTRRDVEVLREAGNGVVVLARRELNRFWRSLDLSRPEVARNALLEFLPVLVSEFGDIATTVAAEWYEDVRAASVGGVFNARTVDPVAAEVVQARTRYGAGHLFTDNPNKTLALLSGAVQKYVLASSRNTIARNVSQDPSRPRWARVPTGAKTCAFCSMLGSRGFVYLEQASAGGLGNDYHDDCDCQEVAQWDTENPAIEGYDPDDLYGVYMSAREAAGSGDPKLIAAEMRRMFPDRFTDGVTAA